MLVYTLVAHELIDCLSGTIYFFAGFEVVLQDIDC